MRVATYAFPGMLEGYSTRRIFMVVRGRLDIGTVSAQ